MTIRWSAAIAAGAVLLSACPDKKPGPCAGDSDCASGTWCVEGACTACPACGAEEVCLRGRCLPSDCSASDPCHAGFACLADRCVDGECLDVTCPSGQACARGTCYPADCSDSVCSASEVCAGACTFSGCAGVVCPEGSACADGACVSTSCGGVVCPAGSVCDVGVCRDARCVGVNCRAGLACWAGSCLDPSIPPALAITEPNGGADFTTNQKSQTVSGTCGPDALTLSTSLGIFVDADCADGTWSLKPFALEEGEQVFTVTARNFAGTASVATLRITYDPPPTVRILDPDSDGSANVFSPSTTVSGTCSQDVVEVTTTRGTVLDGDCSDGTWSLAPYPLPALGPYPFQVSVKDAFGSVASDTITVHYAYIRLEGGADTVYRRDNPTVVNGRCSSEVTSITSSGGTLIDGHCSDNTLSLSFPFDAGDGSYSLTATATSTTQSEDTTLEIVFDTVPPVATVTSVEPASPNPSNFPIFKGKTEGSTRVQLFADAACTVAVTQPLPDWQTSEFTSTGLVVPVVDGSTNAIHARATDRAGNQGPCSAGLAYVDSSAGLPACDVTVNGPTLTFAALQKILEDAQARRQELLADGAVAVCLTDGVVVSTTSPAEGDRLEIPGDDFYLYAPSGRASLVNQRSDSAPSASAARGALRIAGAAQVGLAHLEIKSANGTGLSVEDSRVALLRDLKISGSPTGSSALDFPAVDPIVLLAELLDSVLSGHTGFHIRHSRIRLIRGTTFDYQGGAGIDLANEDVIVSELLDSTISSNHPTNGGTGLSFFTANRSASIETMHNNVFRRGAAATANDGVAIWFKLYPDDRTYVRTLNAADNVFCAQGTKAWGTLLDPTGLPTVPYDPQDVAGTNGARSFPWGAAGEAAANPGYNLQRQWGGACP